VPAVAHPGQQPGGYGPDLGPAQVRVFDGRPGLPAAVEGAVEQLDGQARCARQAITDRRVRRETDDREPAAAVAQSAGTAPRMTGW
jgi:hypothetical protein